MLIVTGTLSGCGGSILFHYYTMEQEDDVYTFSFDVTSSNNDEVVRNVHPLPDDLIRPTLYVHSMTLM